MAGQKGRDRTFRFPRQGTEVGEEENCPDSETEGLDLRAAGRNQTSHVRIGQVALGAPPPFGSGVA